MKNSLLSLLVVSFSLLASAHDGPHTVGPAQKNGELDVLFVVDDSSSFKAGRERLAKAIVESATALQALKLDTHVAVAFSDGGGVVEMPVLSTQDPTWSIQLANGLRAKPDTQDAPNIVDTAYFALNAPLYETMNSSVVRRNADLAVVLVSGGNEQSIVRPLGFYNRLVTVKQGHRDLVHVLAVLGQGQPSADEFSQLLTLTEANTLKLESPDFAAQLASGLLSIH